MAKWWPFGRKDKDQAPAPEPAPEAPRPQPGPAPAPPPADEPRKPGRFRRALDKVRGRGKKEKKKEEAPSAPEPSSAPPSTPQAEPSGPSEGGEPAAVPGDTVGEDQEGEEAEADPYAGAPGSLPVTIPGTWVTSKRAWNGVVTGTLRGQDVVDFLKAMDGVPGYDLNASVQLVCDDFDAQFGAAVDVDASSYSTPQY